MRLWCWFCLGHVEYHQGFFHVHSWSMIAPTHPSHLMRIISKRFGQRLDDSGGWRQLLTAACN